MWCGHPGVPGDWSARQHRDKRPTAVVTQVLTKLPWTRPSPLQKQQTVRGQRQLTLARFKMGMVVARFAPRLVIWWHYSKQYTCSNKQRDTKRKRTLQRKALRRNSARNSTAGRPLVQGNHHDRRCCCLLHLNFAPHCPRLIAQ